MRRKWNPIIAKIKSGNSKIASAIRNMKKLKDDELRRIVDPTQRKLSNFSRCQHIAYCELRGKRREEIEKPAPDNIPNEQLIANLKDIWKTELEKEAKRKEEEKT